jgi:hypothetical protein
LIGDPSVLLWVASALVAFLGARTLSSTCAGSTTTAPLRLWRELLLGSAALTGGLWSALVIDISAQGLPFEVGYHPLKIFGGLLSACCGDGDAGGLGHLPAGLARHTGGGRAGHAAGRHPAGGGHLVDRCRARPVLADRAAESSRCCSCSSALPAAGAWWWRRGGAPGATAARAACWRHWPCGACTVATQELVLLASGLDRQVVSAHARFLPEVAITLVAGAVVPIALVLMLVDQRAQQRVRAAERSPPTPAPPACRPCCSSASPSSTVPWAR